MKKLLLFLFCIPFLGITQNSHTINTVGSTFSPSSLTITVGDTVTWNNTGGSHNVNGTQATFPANPQGFGNGVAAAPWSFQWVFTIAGTYDYQCDPHAPGMSGVIIVNTPAQPLTYVPDDNFEAYLEANGMGNGIANDDSVITININSVTTLSIQGMNISDLTGIEDFSALTFLMCQSNQLTSLDINQNTLLTDLICGYNQLAILDVSQNTALTHLYCYSNQLTSLDVSNNTALDDLDCGSNQLTIFDVSNNTLLTTFNCGSNQLTSLDVSNNTNLNILYCNDNQLTALNVSSNISLTGLRCYNNQIGSLDLSNNTSLNYLKAQSNNFSSLDIRNGNNTNISTYNATQNPNLFCIDVDNPAWSITNWNNVDPWSNFSSNCSTAFGCLDSLACNYDSNATIDDGSCTYWGTSITTDTVCDSYVWSVTGDTLILSGIYTWVNNLSCDTNILNLTINNSTTNIDIQSVIGSYTWSVNGITYTSSVIDTSIGINSSGCSEMHILNLTIVPFPVNLFFSEAAEGSSYNKYFEVYNPTSDTVDLTNYAFARVSNAPTTVGVYEYWVDFDSAAVVLPNDVYVVVHPSADPFIIAEADMDYGSLSNGDDGFALVYGNNPGSPMSPSAGGYVILDWIGDWDADPGQGWDVAGVGAATRNHTLVRKCPISQGDTSWVNAAGTDPVNSQWIVLANEDWSDIGSHTTCICDSSTNSYTSITETICNGLSIVVGNSTYDSTGVYSDTLLAFNGCDSIITTNLTVLSVSASNIINDVTICDGDSVVVGSNVYYIAGTYTDILVNSAGCDSIITTNLTVQTPTYQDITICDGDSIVVGNSVYNSTGSYTDTIISSFGCDSIVHTNLTTYSQFLISGGIPNNTIGGGGYYSGSQYLELSCYMPSELVSAVIYSADTTLTTFEIRDDSGNVLDSVTVNIIPGGHRIYFNYLMSAGSDYELGLNGSSNDLYRNNSGVSYPYNFASAASITSSSAGANYYYFFYDIEVRALSTIALTTNYSICDGESITVAGNVYNTTGLYTDSLTSSIGCDSLVFTNLVVHPNTPYTNSQTICSGETYLIGGNIYDSTGVYTDSLYTQYGCDSIVTTILVVNTLTGGSGVNQQTICFGDSVSVGSNIYFNAGVFSDTLISSNGCDSVVTTYLDVTSANYSTYNFGLLDTLAASGAFSDYDGHLILDAITPNIIKSANVYSDDTNSVTFELRDNSGVVLDDVTHTVYPGIQNLIFDFVLPAGNDFQLGVDASSGNIGLYRSNASIPYPFDLGTVSITGSNAGNQYYYYYYDIEIMPLATYNAYSICEGDSIAVGTNVYDTTGNYTDYFVASNSCDSVVYTVLEVYQTPSLFIQSVPDPPEICLGDSLVIEVTQGFINYWWNTGNPADQDEDRVVVFPTEDFTYVVEALDSNGCEARAEIFVEVDSCISGVNELSFEEGGLQVYPNPASEQLTIDFTGNATSVKVYNMLGELMIEKYISEGQSSVQLFVKEWKGAMYSIQLFRKNGTITHKVFTVVR